MSAMAIVAREFDDGENEIFGLIKRVEDFVLGNRNRGSPLDTPLDLEEPQLAGAGYAALNVIAELVKLAVGRLEAEAALDCHNDRAGSRGAGLSVCRRYRR